MCSGTPGADYFLSNKELLCTYTHKCPSMDASIFPNTEVEVLFDANFYKLQKQSPWIYSHASQSTMLNGVGLKAGTTDPTRFLSTSEHNRWFMQ
jgi:hypothetical protein